MKKITKIFSILLVVIILCGCESSKEKTITCTLNKTDSTNGYVLKSEYNIYAKGDVVKKVETKEVVTSEQDSILSYFKTSFDTTYKNYNNKYGGYTYEVTKDGNVVTSVVTIDYTKMDLEKFSKDNTEIKSVMNDKNELTIDGIKSMYETLGATCK